MRLMVRLKMQRQASLAPPVTMTERLILLGHSRTLQRSLHKNGMSLRDAVRFVMNIDRYACDDSYDLSGVRRLEANALDLASNAAPCPGDPPEFSRWIDALRQRNLSPDIRDAIFDEMYQYFDSEKSAD
jgi:hypothetical protein